MKFDRADLGWRNGALLGVAAAVVALLFTVQVGLPRAAGTPGETGAPVPVAADAAAPVATAEPEEASARGAEAAPPEEPAAERDSASTRGMEAGAAPARSPRTIVIDPGHGGPDPGATRRMADGSVLQEKDLALKVSLATAQMLREAGHTVLLTRTGDTAVNTQQRDLTNDGRVNASDELQARIDFAERAGADLLVSVHFNAGGANARGLEVFHNADRPHSAQSHSLASALYDRLLSAIRATGYDVVGRGVKKDKDATGGAPFFLLGPQRGNITRASQMPAALTESLFVSYPREAELLRSDDFLLRLARAHMDGVLDYLDGSK